MTVVIGTAGHIDHGKTTLLRALTGTDTDRLPEERRRGLSIDVGYAHFAPDDGAEVDFVDVPGHDRLVGNMLVGAGEIDACLLLVAADDGPRAQTYEHLGLLDALGLQDGVAVITKTDLVDAARVAAVTDEVAGQLAHTSLARAPLVGVSATTGAGLDELRLALAHLRDRLGPTLATRQQRMARLAVDRAFSVRGRGVVVTGSSRGRPIASGVSLHAEPEGLTVRVRGVQVHDGPVEIGPAGGRVALNLSGDHADRLRRGHVLVSDPGEADPDGAGVPLSHRLRPTERMLVVLHRPAELPGRRPDDPWPPADGIAARLHIGTDQVDVVVGRSGRDGPVLPDGRAIAMLRLDRSVAASIGDRFVIRRPPPSGLLAGGIVLDPDPVRGRSRRRQTPDRIASLAEAVAEDDPDAVEKATLDVHGLLRVAGRPILAPDVAEATQTALMDAVAAHQADHPETVGMPLAAARAVAASALRQHVSADAAARSEAASALADDLLSEGRLTRDGDTVHTPDHRPPARDAALDVSMARLVALLDVAAPPSLRAAAAEAGCPADGVRELERAGRIVVLDDDLAWSADAYEALTAQALALLATGPVTPAGLRDASGTSRKYVMALLEDLDRRGILRRTPAGHVRGPRA